MPASTTLHESADALTPNTIDMHRALVSLLEELEAVDWYNQRAAAAQDPELQAILKHNRDEEIEHATMTLEWIRRHMPKFDETLRTYLFTTGDITALEATEESGSTPSRREAKPLRSTVGEMKEK